MPAPSPPFKTILEGVLWNGLQSCHHITPDIINVIKMSSFKYFLYLREEKKVIAG
jgi:light-regulated signal transduction histidine kinase (bacteriophytochrome)